MEKYANLLSGGELNEDIDIIHICQQWVSLV